MLVIITARPDGSYDVKSPYSREVIDICKTWGGRWQPDDGKVWRLPGAHEADQVAEELARLGVQVHRRGEPSGFKSPPRDDNSWARKGAGDAALVDLLCDLGLPAYRALTKVTHPDAGGSHEWSQRLNVAWDQARKRSA